MKVVVLSGPHQSDVIAVDDPRPGPHEVVVRVAACGVCGTDLHTLAGENPIVRFPLTPGHEFAGTVMEVGDEVTTLEVGDEVAVDPSRSCGECRFCLSGRANLCPDKGGYGARYAGGFAEQAVVLASSCERLPSGVPLELGVLAEPLACVVHGLDRLGPVSGDRAVVFGAGPIGLLSATLLHGAGADVTVVERDPDRADRGQTLVGVPTLTDAASIERESADVVVDATGSAPAITDGIELLARGGRLLLMGVASPEARVPLSPHEVFRRELSIIGSLAIQGTFARAVAMLPSLQLDGWITHRFPLDAYTDAIDAVRNAHGLKAVLIPHEELL